MYDSSLNIIGVHYFTYLTFEAFFEESRFHPLYIYRTQKKKGEGAGSQR